MSSNQASLLEKDAEAHIAAQEAELREALAATFADYRGDLYLARVREIVIEELNKLLPDAGEPEWQTRTPVPFPKMG
jgi:hypothetical protein